MFLYKSRLCGSKWRANTFSLCGMTDSESFWDNFIFWISVVNDKYERFIKTFWHYTKIFGYFKIMKNLCFNICLGKYSSVAFIGQKLNNRVGTTFYQILIVEAL